MTDTILGLVFIGACVVIGAARISDVIDRRLSDINVTFSDAIRIEARVVSEGKKEAAE